MVREPQQISTTAKIPSQPTPFIGRADEVADITELLAEPHCRLLTLIGPGGVGKTRLAMQTASQLLDNFLHGVFFVPLQAVQAAEFLASAVADAIDLSVAGHGDTNIQLLNQLRDKKMLLVLDNFEHLLPHAQEGDNTGLNLLTDILTTAAGVKLLVSSREVLSLQEEWLYPVEGLPFPTPTQTPHLTRERQVEPTVDSYDAVRLFVERARRVRRDFSLAVEQADIVRICQLVEGMPLALELAAAWTKLVACSVIAAEIKRNCDFLATGLRNVPVRQRSMRAVFDQSWQLLSEHERSVFERLSVFRGGFQRDAGEQIAGATLATLSALVDKSLLRAEPGGRYQIHDLLRQYAAEHLVQSPEHVADVYDLHCAYYTNFLEQRTADLEGGRQRQALREIEADLENIRAAWQWAVELVRVEDIQKATRAYYYFCDLQGRYREGADAFEKAIRKLDSVEPAGQVGSTLAQLLVWLGWHHIRLGKLEMAKTTLDRSRAMYHDLHLSPPPGFATEPLTGLGVLANILGDYTTAAKLGEQARLNCEARADKHNLQVAFYILTNAAFAQGQYEVARRYAEQAYGVTLETDNRWMMAYILSDLGNVARAQADYAQAKLHYQSSYRMKKEFKDPEGMAVALNHLAKIAWLQGSYQEAEQLYRQSLSIYQSIGDQGGLATVLYGLGMTACALNNHALAQQYFQQALEITLTMHFVPLTLSILAGIGEMMLKTARPERGIELLTLVHHHPASDRETKDRAQQSLAFYESQLPPDVFAVAVQRGSSLNLETMVTSVEAELAASDTLAEQGSPQAQDHQAQPGQAAGSRSRDGGEPLASAKRPTLVEPLTPREQEVLNLIAEGLTNQQIADVLIISVGTVKSYTAQIYGKLNVNNRTQAAARARELNILS